MKHTATCIAGHRRTFRWLGTLRVRRWLNGRHLHPMHNASSPSPAARQDTP